MKYIFVFLISLTLVHAMIDVSEHLLQPLGHVKHPAPLALLVYLRSGCDFRLLTRPESMICTSVEVERSDVGPGYKIFNG